MHGDTNMKFRMVKTLNQKKKTVITYARILANKAFRTDNCWNPSTLVVLGRAAEEHRSSEYPR
jgi:hypothetical protein